MAPHSSTLAWKIPWTEEPGRLQSIGLLRVKHDWATSLSLSCIGEGNDNPLQCSCLENPRDEGTWWAAVHGVAQSQTQLKQRSSSSRPHPAAEHSWALVRGNLTDCRTALDIGHAILSPGRSQPLPRVHCRTSAQTYPAQWWGNVIPEGLGFLNSGLFFKRKILLQRYNPVLGLLWFLTCPHHSGFPHNSVDKESACNAGDPSLIPESGRSTGEGTGYPLQYSGLENSMDCIAHGVAKSLTRLSDCHFNCWKD